MLKSQVLGLGHQHFMKQIDLVLSPHFLVTHENSGMLNNLPRSQGASG